MKIQHRFIKFLKDAGVIERYLENWDKKPIKAKESYIYDAFAFIDTNNPDFWYGLAEEWEKICSPLSFHTRCHDCGRFVKKNRWVSKFHSWKAHALCSDCLSGYDEVY